MTDNYFDIKRDNELIAAGSHFWCEACVVARPLVEQSPDPRYCLSCFDVLKVEAEMQPTRRVAWMPRIVKKTTRVNISRETAPAATQTAPARQEVVAKLVHYGKPPITEKQVVMQHPGGRPRKQGEVHRATRWRRAKQGVLL